MPFLPPAVKIRTRTEPFRIESLPAADATTMNPYDDATRREDALAFLYGRINYERSHFIPYGKQEFRLERTHRFLDRLGNPHEKLKIVHVAGTKGKGSTSAMIAAALSAAGYRTGLYTSPHLERLEERFMIDGRPCAAEELVELIDEIRPVVEQMDAEVRPAIGTRNGADVFRDLTAIAFLYFTRRAIDAAVIEVGLGGRLDSTNVCRPMVSVITSISFDHMELLGDTLAKIAAEKAGIIKPGVPVVSGVVDDEPACVINEIAREHHSRVLQLGIDFDFNYQPPRGLGTEGFGSKGAIDFYDSSARRRTIESGRNGITGPAPGGKRCRGAGRVARAPIAGLASAGAPYPSWVGDRPIAGTCGNRFTSTDGGDRCRP